MAATSASPVYRWSGVALLRASTDPGGLDLPTTLDLPGEDAAKQCQTWLSQVWQREDVRAAVVHASPALSRQIDDLLSAPSRDARTMHRAVLSLASYLVRWQQRPTPFGLFAGVGMARIGTGAKVQWGREHSVAVRADASWLGDILTRLHRCQGLLDRLPVVVNDAGTVRGDRFAAPGSPPVGAATTLAPVEVSVRHSRPVRAALEAARAPIPFAALRAVLLSQFATASEHQIDRVLRGLLDEGLLISSLWAPMTGLDALGHACAVLKAADALTIAEIRGTVHELTAIHRDLSTGGSAVAPTSAVADRMRALSTAAKVPLVVDTILDCDVLIPEQVAQEASDAVRVLLRLSPYAFGYPAWRDYHTRFRSRYGTGALVPVLELVADSGLGLPAEYLGSAHGRAARKVSERDEKLLALIQRAIMDGSGEIVLTDQVIEDLTAGDRADLVHLPPRVEVAVEVRAESVEALARGRFGLAMTGTPRPGSSMAGRHAYLLPDEGREILAGTYTAAGPGTIAAQLSFAPRRRRNENVARTGQLLPHVIPVAEHRGTDEHLIPLAGLAITTDESRFHLIELSTGRRVEPRVTHALEAGVQTPPLARFLAEITTARSAVYKAFHFGAAAQLPYLPRIRYRRTILSPARWLLASGDLPGHDASMAEWQAGLDSWRARWRVPERVALVDHDRRQPVDLGHPLHRLLLRTRLERADRLELRETSAPKDLAWLGRAHEVLMPLVLDAPSPEVPSFVASVARAVTRTAGHLPGNSTVLCAQIYGHPARFDEILIERVPGLIDAFGDQAPPWWFRRHREMRRPEVDQYLAVYLRLSDASAYGSAAERVATWADSLHRDRLLSHLTLATHEPQTGRYGHGSALDRAQDVFATDSVAALAQISAAVKTGGHPQALAAASMVDLTVRFARTTHDGLGWLISELRQEHGRVDPALRNQALELADPDGAWTTLRSLPGGEHVVAAWQARAEALTAYREDLVQQRNPLSVLGSLLHLHHIRAVGVDPAIERVTGRLARACVLRHTARRGAH
ncbi:thiopeptide-type bacteriocin biosynthesis domain-containing protein [Lentzea albidocapillata]|uniref:Thiopeptide-type bacteriocin biosynthesis domain-containing protein n=1 Tax=Lentzea albidocapillata TaxID=40571 RepID=A0A1W2FPP7_9PSEU|nr:thiopeptide-type bacteriocin biosynthesis domain-containing protein [Lentzea albidocapillata]